MSGDGPETVIQALRRLPLFAGLHDDHAGQLAKAALRERYSRGDIIFHRGDSGDRAYVIVGGSVDLVIESAGGRGLILARLGPGDHFGEMALLADHERSATARAAAGAELVAVVRRTFLRALGEEPEMARQIIHSLVQRLRVADENMEAFAYLDAHGRIARVVLRLEAHPPGPAGISHEELSHMAATSRQTVTRILDEGGEIQAPMGRAIIGGVITSTLLTLVVVPVLYSYLVRDKRAGVKRADESASARSGGGAMPASMPAAKD